ncbi:ketopantoate reductase family protein [Roseateles chitinivorans]|uniref:ketopantoate reductase family protein n=1 Tax=Roseateles chitinivorans TaxID=2917965 RepID=UPI003D672C61
MKVLVLGAGAMGSYYGARLIEAGAAVSFLVRTKRASALRAGGLVVRSSLGDFEHPVSVIETGSALPIADLVLLTCKAYDLESAVDSVAAAIGPDTAILPLLNGMQPYDYLSVRFGKDRVLGGVSYIAVTTQSDGTTRHLSPSDRMIIGARTAPGRSIASKVHSVISTAAGQRELSDHIDHDLWAKWVMLCAGAAATCLMRGSVSQILSTLHGRKIVEAIIEECQDTAAAEGYELLPAHREGLRKLLLDPSSGWMASMMRDIDIGASRIEADCIVGDMLTRAARHGLRTPLLEIAYAHLQVYMRRHSAS